MQIENLISDLKNKAVDKASVLAYFYNKVCIGIYENGEIQFTENVDYNLLTQIRVFNDKLEVRYVLNEETHEFEHAVIEDNEKINDYFDEHMIVAGDDNKRLIVRNYFEENEEHQVVISKSRLVGFVNGGENSESRL